MNDENDETLKTYENHALKYVAINKAVPVGKYKAWIDQALAEIPQDGKILELGSGDGRDAAYIRSLGYKIRTTDAAESFIKLLRERGFDTQKLNVLTDDFGADYDMVFANAVFLHFTPRQLSIVLGKVKSSLKPGGVLAFSVKKGKGAHWSTMYLDAPRYFQFWESKELRTMVEAAGFTGITISERAGSKAEWFHVIARA